MNQIFSILVLVFLIPLASHALTPPPVSAEAHIRQFEVYRDVATNVKVPTAVEVPFSNGEIGRPFFAVHDVTTNELEPYAFQAVDALNRTPYSITTATPWNTSALYDNDLQTSSNIPLPINGPGTITLMLQSEKAVTASGFTLHLANNVALPTSVGVRAIVDGAEQIILAQSPMVDRTVNFLDTTASSWTIALTFRQPLRMSELVLHETNAVRRITKNLRFLAQPGHAYRIYANPDRDLSILSKGEVGNLLEAKNIIVVDQAALLPNPTYVPADIDNDGVRDAVDNCVSTENSDQIDIDQNGKGDACDDFDLDGMINSIDNCVNMPNRDQRDTDGDGIGDSCDGEESRFTERHAWVPWAGIGFAAFVLVVLLALTARMRPPQVGQS